MTTQQQVLDMFSSLQRDSWIKTYLPLITSFVGLLFGFFLNTIKESATSKINIIKYKKVVRDEVYLALEDSINLARRICKSLDEEKLEGKMHYIYVARVSDICFKEFYPKAIASYSKWERKNLHSFYYNVDFINSNAAYNGTANILSNKGEDIGRLNDIMIAIFTLYRCHGNLYEGKNSETISIGAFLKENNIESNYYQEMIKRAALQNN